MPIDVRFFRDFYATPLGQRVGEDVLRVYKKMVPTVGPRVLGLGYALPILNAFLGQQHTFCWAMLARQGIMPWPPQNPNDAVLVNELHLPFVDAFFDDVVLLHCLEFTQDPEGFLREVTRVTARSGRITLMVPNRLGFWAHRENTPFGYGHPYSVFQITDLLRACSLRIVHKEMGLLCLPSMWSTHPWIQRFWPRPLGGVLCLTIEREPVFAVLEKKPAFVYRPAFAESGMS